MKNTLFYSVLLFVIGFVLVPAVVMGATTTTTFNVQTNLIGACSATASNMDFGDLPASSSFTNNGSSDVTVNCSPGTVYAVRLNGGSNPTGVNTERRLRNGTGYLTYYLYADSARTTIFVIDTTAVMVTGNGSPQSTPIYGSITGSGSQPTGTYSDVVTVTVTY